MLIRSRSSLRLARVSNDFLLCVLLVVGTVVYLYLWPRDLYCFDEGLYLYEAKRILNGDVFYRDFFEIITPGSFYFMALVFRIFGIDLTVARMAMAVLHGLIVTVIYLSCRFSGVRRGISVSAAAAHVAICYWAFSIASPHWFGTFFTLLVLLVFLRRPWENGATWAMVPGFLCGLLISVQQQKGLIITVGACTLLAASSLVDGRHGSWRRALAVPLASFWGGLFLVLLPLSVALIAAAGPAAVFKCLVLHPIVNYRGNLHAPWGLYAKQLPDLFLFPEFMRYFPLVLLPLAALRGALDWFRGVEWREMRVLVSAIAFSLFSILSIAYYPDYTHLAIISPVLFVLAADMLEWGLRNIRAAAVVRFAGLAVTSCLIIGLAWLLNNNLHRRHKMYSVSHMTLFGRVDFSNREEIVLVDKIRDLMRDAPSREIFCYPYCASVYLMTGTENPTRYQVLIAGGYSDPAQVQEAIDVLEARKVRYVAVMTFWINWKTDPVIRYFAGRYERVDLGLSSRMPAYVLFRRKN
jgi:hypothetical protein